MADKEVTPETLKPITNDPETVENVKPSNTSVAESLSANETFLALYYSGDIYVQMCFWLAYILAGLCVAVWLSWRLFGQEVSEILLLQASPPAATDKQPQEDVNCRRSSDGVHTKAD